LFNKPASEHLKIFYILFQIFEKKARMLSTVRRFSPASILDFRQCEQIGQNFVTWAILGYFLLNQFSLKTCSFNTWFAVGILRFQKWFDVDVSRFQIKH
jgi:hypothetical protein